MQAMRIALVNAIQQKTRNSAACFDLSDDELGIIKLYSMEAYPVEESFYYLINSALRTSNRREVWPYAPLIWLLLHALKKLPRCSAHSVYRGVRDVDESLYVPGNIVFWNSFTSCATNVSALETFLGMEGNRIQFLITPHPNCPRLRSIAAFSASPLEYEALYLPNSKFEVIGKLNASHGLWQVQLQELECDEFLIQLDTPAGVEMVRFEDDLRL